MTTQEIKLRQLANQHLLEPTGYLPVVQDLCGMQAQFLSNAFHALTIRSCDFAQPDDLVKSWANRGAMHIFSQDDLPPVPSSG